jgi:hypothetical protein
MFTTSNVLNAVSAAYGKPIPRLGSIRKAAVVDNPERS